jgi:hypothetical protein
MAEGGADGEVAHPRQLPQEQVAGEPRRFPPNAVQIIRTMQATHVSLSQMADQKASILMGATFVIFTITIGQSRGGAGAPLPLLILGGCAFFAAVLAVLAIIPATRTAAAPPRPNLLFFGSFRHLAEEEYIERVMDMLATDESAYRAMARDIYQNGMVLDRKKYRLLGLAYRVFLVGLTASFLAFVAQYALHTGGHPVAAAQGKPPA